MPIRMLPRRPCSVRSPGVRSTASRSAAVTDTSSRSTSSWLSRSGQDAVEDLGADGDEVRVRHPRPVEPGLGLAGLVLAHLGERALVDLGVAPARDERRHAADRERTTAVAGADQQVAVGLHHRSRHRHGIAVGEGEGRSCVTEVLDDAEQVVPAPGVQPGGVVAQLVEDLVHLEGRGDRLDQHRRPHRPVRHPQRRLGVAEDLVPEPRLEVGLHLGQVVVRPAAAGQQLAGVVEEVQAEVDEGRDHRPAVRGQVRLVEVPAARSRQDHRRPRRVGDGVLLALRGGEGQLAARRRRAGSAGHPRRCASGGCWRPRGRRATRAAPELSALIAIFGSVGPVISTRRSCRSAGTGATVQSPARTSAVAARKSRVPVRTISARRSRRAASSSSRRSWNRASRSATKASASGVRTSADRGTEGAVTTRSGIRPR